MAFRRKNVHLRPLVWKMYSIFPEIVLHFAQNCTTFCLWNVLHCTTFEKTRSVRHPAQTNHCFLFVFLLKADEPLFFVFFAKSFYTWNMSILVVRRKINCGLNPNPLVTWVEWNQSWFSPGRGRSNPPSFRRRREFGITLMGKVKTLLWYARGPSGLRKRPQCCRISEK